MRLVHGEVLELILHLIDVGDDVTVQKLEGGGIAAQYQSARCVDNQDTGIDRIENKLEIFLLLNLFIPRMLQDFLETVERSVDETAIATFRKAEGIVAAVDGLKEELHLMNHFDVARPQHDDGDKQYDNDATGDNQQ